MNIEQEVQSYSKGLSIPSDRLEFNSYYDQQRQADITQIFFRDEYPPKDKYAFEIVAGGTDDMVEDMLHRNLEKMEQAYLDNSGRVTFYKGQGFFWREVAYNDERDFKGNSDDVRIEPDEKYLKIQCTSCGWQLESPEIKAGKFNKYRDIVLMWLLARGKGRCDCDQFEPVEGHRDSTLDLEKIKVEEGERLPRADRKI